MKYDVVIIGGGLSGLTTAAFLCQAGKKVILCEKEAHVGGLLGSFAYKGYTFDAGARAIENSGVLIPMLNQLGIHIPLLRNPVSIGIENDIIHIESGASLEDYKAHLLRQFPSDSNAIIALIQVIKKVMKYMDILYGIDNPLFMDLKNDKTYIKETLLPWLVKYILTVGKIKRFQVPIDEYLERLTDNGILVDMIAQHFFSKTPAFFALSYFSLYLDYRYPKGGTGTLIDALRDYIVSHSGEIKTSTCVNQVDLIGQKVVTEQGDQFEYRRLVWCADNKSLYRILRTDSLSNRLMARINRQRSQIAHHRGGDSVLTLYVTSKTFPAYFREKHSAHFFYTPVKKGLHQMSIHLIKDKNGSFTDDKTKLFNWLSEFLALTTYEISVPCLRDESLAPSGNTGLIISTLFDYDLTAHLSRLGLYDEAKTFITDTIIKNLEKSIYPAFRKNISDTFIFSPLNIEKTTGNSDGAITGWSFMNGDVPAVSQMTKIAQSVKTPLPGVFQAGQWTYSPSGLPISILTGKLAASAVIKDLKRVR